MRKVEKKRRDTHSRTDVEEETEVCEEEKRKVRRDARENEARRVRKLTDVNDMPFSVDHDVSVVTILDLEDVAGDGVGGHTLDEVHSSLLEGNRVDGSVLVDEEAEEIVDLCSTHLVSGGSVGNDVDDSTLMKGKGIRRER